MTAEEIVSALEDLPEGGLENTLTAEEAERHFIFSIGTEWFSIDPRMVREIAAGLELYPLPGCPPYVSGLVNHHGIPCAVLDLSVLLQNERLELPIRLILNRPEDSVALSCTDVVEIAEIPLSSISRFVEGEQEAGFFTASFSLREHRVLCLSVDAVMAKLGTDLA